MKTKIIRKTIICIICVTVMLVSGCGTPKINLPAQKEVTEKTIKDVFSEHNMKVGTCISSNVINNTAMAALVKEQFNSLTMENAMKPDYILNQKQEGSDVCLGDSIVNGEVLKPTVDLTEQLCAMIRVYNQDQLTDGF